MAYGAPNYNIAMVPVLVSEMEKRGHAIEYTKYDGASEFEVFLDDWKAEVERLQKKSQKTFVGNRTSADVDDLLPWSQQRMTF